MTPDNMDPFRKVFSSGSTAPVVHPQPQTAVAVDHAKVPAHVKAPDFHHMFGFSTEEEATALVHMLAPFGVTGPTEPQFTGGYASPALTDPSGAIYKQWQVDRPGKPPQNAALLLRNIDFYGPVNGWAYMLRDVNS